MTGITDFLKARIDEDEQVALEVTRRQVQDGERDENQSAWADFDEPHTWPEYTQNYHDVPAVAMSVVGLMRECRAKRQIIQRVPAGSPALKMLASIYRNHADFNEEWEA